MTDILDALCATFPEAKLEAVQNPSPSAQHSLLADNAHAAAIAAALRDTHGFDLCSNVSGVDWPARKIKETIVRKEVVDGEEKEVKETVEREIPGHLEVVYHLYSVAKKSGPFVLRLRTGDRENDVAVPSLTPGWKSAEVQEREVFDLFGVRFTGHPDLRRLLMWDEFADHPMRKDYVAPDDYEYEPTPHDEVLERLKARGVQA